MENNSIKRSLKDGCRYPHTETKKPKAAQVTTTISHPKSSKKIIGLQDLSDEVIMYIFKYLSHDDLAKMALLCPNLSRVSHDWSLWKKPRFENFEKSMEEVYLSYLKKDTTELFISCNDVPSHDYSVSENFLIKLKTKCPELLDLTLKNQVFDEINVNIFHPKLKTLTIDSSTIENVPANTSFLISIDTCPDLERLIITNNDWFLPQNLYALSKLERLNYLSLAGCKQFKDCVPYASITTIIGFDFLQTLDLRFTPVSDRELVFFQRLPTLKNFLLECPEYMNHEIHSTITDLGLAELCAATLSFRYPYLGVMMGGNGERCCIETFYVRNYPKVTGTFLRIAITHCPHLKLLDIIGSGCTSAEIEYFKAIRPSTKVIY
ncbi:unnamed protein product [Macrosiphum euphorbiae]|uniref:F-box domain-containing protein n=1 Tax=Macrosiphum euphorbiae TaxID=13131 RepID=A0AAV0Y464_9HEMI|nr:unnamed protein product [Macrosiphum euphorbiae]